MSTGQQDVVSAAPLDLMRAERPPVHRLHQSQRTVPQPCRTRKSLPYRAGRSVPGAGQPGHASAGGAG
jgi:hypothetical protein